MKLEKFERKMVKIVANSTYTKTDPLEQRFMDDKGRLVILRMDTKTIITNKYICTYFNSTGKIVKKRW